MYIFWYFPMCIIHNATHWRFEKKRNLCEIHVILCFFVQFLFFIEFFVSFILSMNRFLFWFVLCVVHVAVIAAATFVIFHRFVLFCLCAFYDQIYYSVCSCFTCKSIKNKNQFSNEKDAKICPFKTIYKMFYANKKEEINK